MESRLEQLNDRLARLQAAGDMPWEQKVETLRLLLIEDCERDIREIDEESEAIIEQASRER